MILPATNKKILKTKWHTCWCIKCSHLCLSFLIVFWQFDNTSVVPWCQILALQHDEFVGALYWKIKFVSVFQVACFPFDDHNCPPIQLVISFCHSAYSWLKEDIENVVVVHCKAGKARTGLMISSLLLFLKVRLPCILSVYQSEWDLLQNLHQLSYNWSFFPFIMDSSFLLLRSPLNTITRKDV
jgi:hypothetical protein